MKKFSWKKALLMSTSLVLTAVLAIGGTLAYLQDEDSDVNVMTLGNVEIEQIEQERDANGNLVDFTQGKPAYPAVGPVEWATKGVDVNGTEYKVFTDELKNVVDKIVTVNNVGKSDAYVRTLVAIEAPDYDPENLIHINWNSTGVSISDPVEVEINGVDYVVFAFTYEEALASGEKSAPSLMQLFLDSAATNEDCEKFGSSWDVMVLSQAIQTEGFADAANALNTGFGDVTEENVIDWFTGVAKQKGLYIVDDADEAYDAFSALDQSGVSAKVVLNADYNTADAEGHWSSNREYALRAAGTNVTFDLNGNTVNHNTSYQNGNNTGYTYLFTTAYNGKLTVNGEGSVYSENTDGNVSIFYAQGPSEITINGGEYHAVSGVPVWAGNGATVNINGGKFTSSGSNNEELIYSSGGIINIYDGFFHNEGWEERPVNVADANRSTGRINIYGGTFVNFDPSTGGNDPGNIRVMDGYMVVSETKENGDVWYTVVPVPEGATLVDDLDALKEAFAKGGTVILTDDIELEKMTAVETGADVYLNMNGKTLTVDENTTSNTFIWVKDGAKLTIDGNGTIDLGSVSTMAIFCPYGELVIENGTFIRDKVETVTDATTGLFMGAKSSGCNVTINGGYFDPGYYDENAADIEKILAGEATLNETAEDIANRNKPGDTNAVRVAVKDNVSVVLNHSGYGSFKVYGGTFVGANPAWGDEGCMLPTTPNYLRPWSYYQGALLAGQEFNENGLVIPDGYTITKSENAEGIPVYTVEYNK